MKNPIVVQNAAGNRKARIALPVPEDMQADQRQVYEEIVHGRRGRLIGPLRAALLIPPLARAWSQLGEFLRYNSSIPARLSELAILAVARRWSSDIEWWVHAEEAEKAGLPQSIIEAIKRLESPSFDEDGDRDIYTFVCQIQETGKIDDAVYLAVQQKWGDCGVVELTAITGYYTMVAMTLNAHRLPLPDEVELIFPSEEGLNQLAPAA